MNERRSPMRIAAAALALGSVAASQAMASDVRFVPLIGIGTTWSDNPALQADAASKPGWIRELVPGLRAESHGGPLELFGDARWHILRYSNARAHDKTQGAVDARARYAFPKRIVFLDGNIQVAQQGLNPFGPASTPDRPNTSANRIETRLFQVAPNAHGYVADYASYQASMVQSTLRTDQEGVPAVNATQLSLRVRNPSPSSRLGWAADAREFRVKPAGDPSARDERLRATFLAEIADHLRVNLIAGRDDTDFLFGGARSGTARGAGLDWNPGPRTSLAGVYEHRFYGDFHDVQMAWRSPRTAWRMSSVSDLTVLPNLLTNGATTPTLQLMNDLLASAIPDRIEREAAARRELAQRVITGAAPLSAGYLSSRPAQYQEDEIAAALLGVRNTLTLRADRRKQRTRGPALFTTPVTPADDNFRQVRYSVQWAHRATPLTTLALEAARLQTRSLTVEGRESLERRATLTLHSRLGLHSALDLGVRRLLFGGQGTGFSSFTENAIFALLTVEL